MFEWTLYEEIGIACDCHPEFGQYCVVELGTDVKERSNHTVSLEYSEHHLPNDSKCPLGRTDITCRPRLQFWHDSPHAIETDYDDDENTGTVEQILIDSINRIRVPGMDYTNVYAQKKRDLIQSNSQNDIGEPLLKEFTYSEALSLAARHVLADSELCGSIGDRNGKTIGQVLRRYYGYDVQDLRVLKLTTSVLNWDVSEDTVATWILQQNCFDIDIITEIQDRFLGVGCAGHKYDSATSEFINSCYIVTAKHVTERGITGGLPLVTRIADAGADVDTLGD